MFRIALFLFLPLVLVSCGIEQVVEDVVEYPQELIVEAQAASSDILQDIKKALSEESADPVFRLQLIEAVRAVHSREPELKGRAFLVAMVRSSELKVIILERIDADHPRLKELPALGVMVDQQVEYLSNYVMNPKRDVKIYLTAISMVLGKNMFDVPQLQPEEENEVRGDKSQKFAYLFDITDF